MGGRFSSAELGFKTLTARSVVLSALLGEHPPQLPGRALIGLGGVLGIAEGTMRTALSRMAQAGEISVHDGAYVLGERMLLRQRAQDSGREPAPGAWDGTWWFAIVDAQRRSLGERREFRFRMREHRMGELRPEVWLRPANIPGPVAEAGVLNVRGRLTERDLAELIARLWNLDDLAQRARTLTRHLTDALSWVHDEDRGALRDASLLTVAVLRFLLIEPRLPAALVGDQWPLDDLRATYGRFETAYRARRTSFLADCTP